MEEVMEILREEVHVKHNGNVFRRVYDTTKNKLHWELFQSTPEAEIWSSMPEGACLNLNKIYAETASTEKRP